MTRQVRSHAKGCFIELDTLHEDGQNWETNYRWNYAVQENVKRHGFSFPEADVLLLLDLSQQLVNEHVMLDPEVNDFADLAMHVVDHVEVIGKREEEASTHCASSSKSSPEEVAKSRAAIVRLLASKNEDLQKHLDDLASDPILMPGEGEHAMSINVFCTPDIQTKQLVFVRLDKPVMCFMDSVIAAQYCLFCFGPPELEDACVAEGCAFAAVMSDYNFEMAVKQAANPQEVLHGFESCIKDLVVLPHVHMHNSIRNQAGLVGLDGNPDTRARGSSGSNPASPSKSLSREGSSGEGGSVDWGKVRNRPDAEDILEEILELCIQDFDHAEEEKLAGHDLHSETHHHEHVDGEAILFDDSSHTESFVQMMAVDTDGPEAGRKRTLHRWHNALQQDCLSELCVDFAVPHHQDFTSAAAVAEREKNGGNDYYGGTGGGTSRTGGAAGRGRRPSFRKGSTDSDLSLSFTAGGCGGAVRTERRPSMSGGAASYSGGGGGCGGVGGATSAASYFGKDSTEWSAPHLPHGSAHLMALAADELSDPGCIFLNVDAGDVAEMYQATARRLRARMDVLGLTRLVGELGAGKLLAFLEYGGQWPTSPTSNNGSGGSGDMDYYGEMAANLGRQRSGSSSMLPRALARAASSPAAFNDSSSSSSPPTAFDSSPALSTGSSASATARSRRGSFTSRVFSSGSTNGDDTEGGGGGGSSVTGSFLTSSASRRAKEEAELFLETDHGGGGTWHEESMEVLCVHSAVLPPGRRVVILVRLSSAVESDLGEGSPAIRWLYVCLGSFHPREVAKNEGMARAVSLFFASDDVYDLADNATEGSEILEAIRSFMRHSCIVPRARPISRVKIGMLAAQTMAQERLQAAHDMWESFKQMNRKENRMETALKRRLRKELKLQQQMTHSSWLTRCKATVQKFSLPLLFGVLLALVFCNVSPTTYEYVVGTNHHHVGDYLDLSGSAHWKLLGHPLTIHFLVNDLFMVFFFGLAAKEVTEAMLPGGALNPIRKALSPLLATLGGVVGPVTVYLICAALFYETGSFSHLKCDDDGGGSSGGAGGGDDDHHRRRLMSGGEGGGDDHSGDDDGPQCEDVTMAVVLSGWGVPTATDISLAWMVAVLVFGLGHNAIGFLLLLAVVDDGIGLVIIAIFYPDPENPVRGEYLPLIPLGMLLAYGLRRLKVEKWFWYVAIAGPPSWFGFLLSHVHPALALVPIVPFLPATHFHDDDDDGSDAATHGNSGSGTGDSGGVGGGQKSGCDAPPPTPGESCPSSVEPSPLFGPAVVLAMNEEYEAELGLPPPPPLPPHQQIHIRGRSSSGGGSGGGDDHPDGKVDVFGFLDFQQIGKGIASHLHLPHHSHSHNTNRAASIHNKGGKGGKGTTNSRLFGSVDDDDDAERQQRNSSGGLELGLAGIMDYIEEEAKGGDRIHGGGGIMDYSLDCSAEYMEESKGGDGVMKNIQKFDRSITQLKGDGGGEEGRAGSKPDYTPNNSMRPVTSLDSNFSQGSVDGGGGGGGSSGKNQQQAAQHQHAHPALHQFEHDLKLFVDFGMFFFAFANAGVRLSDPGGLTLSIILALVVGKTLGISAFAIAGDAFFGIKLPDGVTYGDVVMVAFIASMGLTVALFVAGEAFSVLELQEEAKMGALLSGLVGPVALLLDRFWRKPRIARLAAAKARSGKRGANGGEAEFNAHVMRTTEEIDENVVREGLLRLLKKRHADFEVYKRYQQMRQESPKLAPRTPRYLPPGSPGGLPQLAEGSLSGSFF